ncbi:XVIPCD domain-containing protein [Pseudomonas sp. CGJS7]|uniref:XVIPCD domain-containing protein n=1 Tax=Pseudomonas sp. CGJS7 TaxID=3109348 RepID=UPI003008EC08
MMRDMPVELVPLLNGLSPASKADIVASIESSPYLAATLTDAVSQGRVDHIVVTVDPHEGGHYDVTTRTISVSADLFAEKNAGVRIDGITATLGHEASHAYFSGHLEKALARFDAEVSGAIGHAEPGHRIDLTGTFERYLLAAREGEALAEIGSMNALASRVREQNDGEFDRKDFLVRADASTRCIGRGKDGVPAFARDIRMSDDGRIYAGSVPLIADKHNPNPNREAVALCHFDLKPRQANLGRQGESDYPNYYATRAIEFASDRLSNRLNPLEISLDLDRLKLDPALLERNGLDLGGPNKVFSFIDTSKGGMEWRTLHHTKVEPSAVVPDLPTEQRASRADQSEHPDHPQFEAIRSVVHADGRWDTQQTRNISAAVLAATKADPVVADRIAGVVVGRTSADGSVQVFAYSSPHGPQGPHHHVGVDAATAAQASAERSLDRVEQLSQQRHVSQQPEQQPDPTQPGPGAPTPRH